jgi:hypothetical protein
MKAFILHLGISYPLLPWLAACGAQRRSRRSCPVVVGGTREKKNRQFERKKKRLQ